MLSPAPQDDKGDLGLRIAFDFDGVLATEASEQVHQREGIEKFRDLPPDELLTNLDDFMVRPSSKAESPGSRRDRGKLLLRHLRSGVPNVHDGQHRASAASDRAETRFDLLPFPQVGTSLTCGSADRADAPTGRSSTGAA